MKTFKLIIMVALTAVLFACAAAEERPSVDEQLAEMGLQRGEAGARIPRYRINGWEYLDDENITVTAGVNSKYLVELRSFCFGLREAYTVGFATPMARLDKFGDIVVRGQGRRRETCAIDDIVALTPVE